MVFYIKYFILVSNFNHSYCEGDFRIMEDYIILRAGYNQAIKDIIETLKTESQENPVIKDKILRAQRKYLIGNTEYEGFLYKHYDRENNIGYVLFDDIYELKGFAIFIDEGTCKELDCKELLYARSQYELIWNEGFKNQDLINLRYKELLDKWKKI